MKTELHCDFCDMVDPQPNKTYACKSFDVLAAIEGQSPVQLLSSIGSWLACEACAALIDANDVEGLTERAISHFGNPTKETPAQTEFLRHFLKRQNEQFMQLRLQVH